MKNAFAGRTMDGPKTCAKYVFFKPAGSASDPARLPPVPLLFLPHTSSSACAETHPSVRFPNRT